MGSVEFQSSNYIVYFYLKSFVFIWLKLFNEFLMIIGLIFGVFEKLSMEIEHISSLFGKSILRDSIRLF